MIFDNIPDLTNEELEMLDAWWRQVGRIPYEKLLKKKFSDEYKKLRNCRTRTESTYGKINGILNGLEYAMNVVQEEIDLRHRELQSEVDGQLHQEE